MIATPYWSGLDIAVTIHNACCVIPVHIPLDRLFDIGSVTYYQEALKAANSPVKAVLLCNPHNPTGGRYPLGSLMMMAHFCKVNNLHLICDEVYAFSVHSQMKGRTSGLYLYGLDFVHTVYSMSKDFGCNGIRIVSGSSQGLPWGADITGGDFDSEQSHPDECSSKHTRSGV